MVNLILLKKLKNIFRSLDENNDGTLSKKELLNGFLGAGLYSDAKFIFSSHRDQPVFNFTDDILPYYTKIQHFIEIIFSALIRNL